MENQRCSGCRTLPEDWDADPDAYIADVEVCPGCQRLAEEQRNDVAKADGARIGLLPRALALEKVATYAEDGGGKK